MSATPLSLILLPSLDCNAACDYCFEEKSPIRLSLGGLHRLTAAILDHMETTGARERVARGPGRPSSWQWDLSKGGWPGPRGSDTGENALAHEDGR